MLEGLAKERPSVRMQGKEINGEQAGKELTRAREAGEPGEEMKERQAPQTRPRTGVNTVQEPRVLRWQGLCLSINYWFVCFHSEVGNFLTNL